MKFLFAITLMILVLWMHPGFAVEPPNEVTQEELIEWISNLDPATRVCDFSKFASYRGFRNSLSVTNEMLALLGKQCPTLESIDLSCCNSITYEGVASLASLCYPHLQQLNLSSSTRQYPQGSAFQSFKEILRNCPELTKISYRNFSGETLRAIGKYSQNFECLKLVKSYDSSNDITNEDVISLALVAQI